MRRRPFRTAIISAVVLLLAAFCTTGALAGDQFTARVYPSDFTKDPVLVTNIHAPHSDHPHSFFVDYGGGRGAVKFSDIKLIEYRREFLIDGRQFLAATITFRDGGVQEARVARELLKGFTKFGTWEGGTERMRRLEFIEE